MSTSFTTPGVYIAEVNAFPNAVMSVATAIPAFIGYSTRASYEGKSYTGVPVPIQSLNDFMAYFGVSNDNGTPVAETEQYKPVYYALVAADPKNADLTIGSNAYDIEPDPSTVYYLYNSIKFFYANGGGTCYVVSVGPYGTATGTAKTKTDPLINPNVALSDLTGGLAALVNEAEPTMIVIPDAVLLNQSDNASLNQAVLAHCSELQSRVGLLDVWHGNHPDAVHWMDDIASFRSGVGTVGLGYGAAYYPFLKTSVMTDSDINYENLGGSPTLSSLLPDAHAEPLKTLIASIDQPSEPTIPSPVVIENALIAASPTYKAFHDIALAKMNILPPSGAMAGVYTRVDNAEGVWRAPANTSLVAVNDTTVHITDALQSDLNVDAVTGKSVNAIRVFLGRGVLVWGARTLDGNSQDWRYINVRRLLIMLEQSMKAAIKAYVFEANEAKTWTSVRSMLENFLTGLWKQGAMVGSKPDEAFSVAVGLGTTMTAQDILNGVMNVSVCVAVLRPAEFIVITLQQQMQSAA